MSKVSEGIAAGLDVSLGHRLRCWCGEVGPVMEARECSAVGRRQIRVCGVIGWDSLREYGECP